MLEFLNNPVVAGVIKSAIVIFALLTAFAYMTLIERRVVAKLQGRLGPNRAGPSGMFQPVADAIKMAFKEQIVPSQAKKAIYLVAPIISVVVALCAFAVVPIGNSWVDGKPSVWDPVIGDINVGLLWILSISSLAVYGIVLGGWASGNRYSLLGSLRSAAQMVSYETSLGLALSGTLMFAGTLSMVGIVTSSAAPGHLVRCRAAAGLLPLPDRRYRRGQPRSIRSAGSRAGIDGWLPDRIQRPALEPLPDGRVHQHDNRQLHRCHALLWRLELLRLWPGTHPRRSPS